MEVGTATIKLSPPKLKTVFTPEEMDRIVMAKKTEYVLDYSQAPKENNDATTN